MSDKKEEMPEISWCKSEGIELDLTEDRKWIRQKTAEIHLKTIRDIESKAIKTFKSMIKKWRR